MDAPDRWLPLPTSPQASLSIQPASVPSPFIETAQKRLASEELTVDATDDAEASTRVKKRKLPVKECEICCEDKPTNRFPKHPHAGAELHSRGVCFKCWELHLNAEIELKPWDTLTCAQCDHIMEMRDILKLERSFDRRIEPRIMDKATKVVLDNDQTFVTCPSSTCSYGAYMIDGDVFQCRMCNFRFCVSCQVPMHEGKTCTQHQNEVRRRERGKTKEERLSAKTLKKKYKLCPKCHTQLDKYVGCDHVRCANRGCGFEFCWICFAPYVGPTGIHARGNIAHQPSCRYHPTKLPNYIGPA